ncbi:MAG TPA: hypothetical protein VFK41_13695 [Nocardioidaceae bacterium]|nr:hypothetical protein [Nocardioidaceae bacterium]
MRLWLAVACVVGAIVLFTFSFVLAGDDRTAAALGALVATVALCFAALRLIRREGPDR